MPIFKPLKRFFRATDITAEYLKSIGVKGVALDADNTMSEHHSQIPLEGAPEWIEYLKSNHIKVLMVSNAKSERVLPFAKKLGVDYIHLALKPLPFGFVRAAKRMGINKNELAVIGDQIFTDMIGANIIKAKALLVTPIKAEDKLSFKIRRNLENKLLKKYTDI
ncbi:MAG: YqeG family HAD IIIA-type phosphatase [Acutalibacteraceae bacterium]|nr:YqeG family HAD IIIA-type phosphatase [Acutalibacteraceae bacterium]